MGQITTEVKVPICATRTNAFRLCICIWLARVSVRSHALLAGILQHAREQQMRLQQRIAVSQSFSAKIMTVQQMHSRKIVFCLLARICYALKGEMVSKKSRAETCIAEYIIYNITWHINYRISTSKYMYLYTYNIYIYMFIYLHICFNVYIYADIELLTYMCFVKIQFYGRLTWQINASVGNEKTLGSL